MRVECGAVMRRSNNTKRVPALEEYPSPRSGSYPDMARTEGRTTNVTKVGGKSKLVQQTEIVDEV